MSKRPSKLDRFNWNPIVPGLILAWWLSRLAATGWNISEMGWFRLVGLGIMILWFGLAVYNYLSGGKLLEFLFSDDDAEFEVPESLAALKKQIDLPETPLTKAIEENLPAGRDLEEAIEELGEIEITEREEGMVVVTAYRELCESDDPRCAVLLQQFRNSGNPEVSGGFFRYGMPLVHDRLRTLRSRPAEPEEYDFDREEFQLLAILCGYAYQPAFSDIASAARDPDLHDSYLWGLIFDGGNEHDEDTVALIKQLGKELPTGFACVAYLDRCNQLCLEHELEPHPFSSDTGLARLREYISDPDREHYSYAKSATTALYFISHPGRDGVLDLAASHPDPNVIVEAAWAGAKLGRRGAIDTLAALTADWKTGARAMASLRELELEQRIPSASLEPKNVALCEMADWLQHPNELAEMPDQLEILDQREIFWPPLEDRAHVSIIKWILGDDSGTGMTGGTTTWCFFGQDDPDEPPIDIYARHCNWQLSAEEIEGVPEDYDALDYSRDLLREKNPDEDWSPRSVN